MIVYIFGVIDLFCLVNFVLLRIVEDNWKEFDFVIVDILRDNYYVDDLFKFMLILESVIMLMWELIEFCVKGGFNFMKFMSNN